MVSRLLSPLLVICSLGPLAAASDANVRGLQSGDPDGKRLFHEAGIYGEGEIIAVLDTGLEWDSCFFDGPGTPPPVNTVTPNGELETSNVDLSRRKVVAYDLLYSCDEFPAAAGCEIPYASDSWESHGHGTVNAGAAAGDAGDHLLHDSGDGVAPGAKLVIQDGHVGFDLCTSRPGFGCPLRDLRTVLGQAHAQGARIHTNSWGNRQGTPPSQPAPTGNYTAGASQIDAFVHEHRDMLVVFNTGNAGQAGETSLSSPGSAKNTLQVGAFWWNDGFPAIEAYSGRGPTVDGRLKPDLVGPGRVISALPDLDPDSVSCAVVSEVGTSWAAPSVAGLAALAREYFRRGFLPGTEPFVPSAALLKAVLIAGARPLRYLENGPIDIPVAPVPSPEQGFGYPVLGDVLPLPGGLAPALHVFDEPAIELSENETIRFVFRATLSGRVRVVVAWSDAAAAPAPESAESVLVNDLDLIVRRGGEKVLGNESFAPELPDRLNNVELVALAVDAGDVVTVEIRASAIRSGSAQSAALVISGDLERVPMRRRAVRRR